MEYTQVGQEQTHQTLSTLMWLMKTEKSFYQLETACLICGYICVGLIDTVSAHLRFIFYVSVRVRFCKFICNCGCKGVSDLTEPQLCIHSHFTSLSDAVTSWVVILTAVWALAGWQIGITDCLGYLDSKIAIKSTLIKLPLTSDMLRHIEKHFIVTDKDTSDTVEANLKNNTINRKSLKCCSLVG